jgi:hypothetical protein
MVKLVDQGLLSVNELADDIHKWRNLRGARLVDHLKDLTDPDAFLVAVVDLVVPIADVGVAVLE